MGAEFIAIGGRNLGRRRIIRCFWRQVVWRQSFREESGWRIIRPAGCDPYYKHCNSSRASQISKESRGLARMTRIGNAGILRRSKSVFIRGNRPSVSAALSCVPRVFNCQRACGRNGPPGIDSIVHKCTRVSIGPQPIVVRAAATYYRLWSRPKGGAVVASAESVYGRQECEPRGGLRPR
jgi:hypothetical protein